MNRSQIVTAFLLALLAGTFAACSSDKPPAEKTAEHTEDAHESGQAEKDAHIDGDERGNGHAEEHEHDEHGDEEGHEDLARIDPANAKQHGIVVSQASSGTVAESIALTGRLIIDPRAVAQVRARFAGPVRSVAKNIGESVRKGEVLATVESNDSLTVYDVPSPIAGVVLERMTNPGDVAGSEPLFRIGNLSSLQAELKVFQKDQTRVRPRATALVQVGDQVIPGKVVNLVPELESRTQAMLVRVELTPNAPITASPGQFVTGQVMTGEGDAAVAINADALQRFEGQEVIFVPAENGFRPRAVTLGRRGLDRVEVLEGLQQGENYVSEGAFLIKAELGKGEAGHDH